MKDKLKFALVFIVIAFVAVVVDRYIGYGIAKANATSVTTAAAPVLRAYNNETPVRINKEFTAHTLVYEKPLRYCTVITPMFQQQSAAISCVLAPKEN
jgi:hypothetical protein